MSISIVQRIILLFKISKSSRIARRYFVVNGFDGALTTLGLLIGFYMGETPTLHVAITACLSAAIALGMSGFSSGYVSEAAEKKREFHKLQTAMVSDLSGSAQDRASRWAPLWIALVNGLAPMVISLIIVTPLLLASAGFAMPYGPYEIAIATDFFLIFLLGVFLGRVGGTFWLFSGFQTVAIGLMTVLLIYLIA